MNRLRNTRVYLIGAMDRVTDGGVGWRQEIRKILSHVGIQWLDPTCKPIHTGEENQETRNLITKAKEDGDYDYVAKQMKLIRNVDLRMTDLSDWVIVHIDLDVHACGSYEEITTANRQKKPILICVKQGKKHAPNWLFGMVPHQHIFGSWSDLLDYVVEVDQAETIEHMRRWFFFDWTLCN